MKTSLANSQVIFPYLDARYSDSLASISLSVNVSNILTYFRGFPSFLWLCSIGDKRAKSANVGDGYIGNFDIRDTYIADTYTRSASVRDTYMKITSTENTCIEISYI